MYCKHYLPLLLLFLGTIFHSKSQKLTENNIKKAYAEVEGKIKEDHLRPAFHLTPPSGCMGDPNGGIYHNGRYHIFYGHNPFSGSYGGWFWGHASSKDLLNWRHEPPMLTPAFDLGISSLQLVFAERSLIMHNLKLVGMSYGATWSPRNDRGVAERSFAY